MMTTCSEPCRGSRLLVFGVFTIVALGPAGPFGPSLVRAVPMTNDPGGFLHFPWGTSLEGKADLSPPKGQGRVQEYDLVQTPLRLGDVPVSSIRLVTIDGKFGRAVVRYEGRDHHRSLLAALQQWFGALDLTPGQLGAGSQLQQHFNWRGPNTEINVTYDVKWEQGVMFVESQMLAPRFNEEGSGQ